MKRTLKENIMIEKWNIKIPELTGEESRRLYLYLPESYAYEHDRRYPVLYMFDGHNIFFDSDATYGKSWGMKDYMDYTNTQLIIAAVECNHSPDFGRLKEYSPFSFTDPKFGFVEGKGRTTMEWLVHTLKPQIDREYRTLSDRMHTYIAGSSMGGLMSLYAVLEYNHIFAKAAALSPSIWTNPRMIDQLIRTAALHKDTTLYMDYGSREIHFHKSMKERFRKVSELLYDRGIFLTTRIVPHGDHCEASWEKQIPIFLPLLLAQP